MCGFENTLGNIIPIDWLDPYGRTPFAKDAELSVDITIVETEDGIRATSIKNPPKAGPSRLMDAIKNALGVSCFDDEPMCSSPQAADQGKRNEQDSKENASNTEKHDTMNPSSHGDSRDRDRNPSSHGSPEPSRYGATKDEDEEKAPGNKS